ncbi:MAG: GNAT family N-acetyltransferase [Dinoroseobacter sp.]|nr:GNAT family N-acetyltransferase [Dinoroseobacter sp.]
MDDVVFRDAVVQDIPWLVERHDVLYRSEAGFDATFALVVGKVLKTYFAQHDPEIERAFIPETDAERLGSLFVTRSQFEDSLQLRLFWLEPTSRGKGLAQEMLDCAIDHARCVGARALCVRTYDRHVAACRLYARSGFRLTDTRAALAYGQHLTEQSWRLEM